MGMTTASSYNHVGFLVVEACRLDGYDNGIDVQLSIASVVEACRLDGYDNHRTES